MSTSKQSAILALREAIKQAGGQSKLAALVGRSQGHVSYWVLHGLPSRYAPAIELATEIPVERLCPTTTWIRVPDATWPLPGGRPLVDMMHRDAATAPAAAMSGAGAPGGH